MPGFSPEATDITAALARCAISRTFAVFDSAERGADAAGVASATWTDADADSFVGAPSLTFGASASFGNSAGTGATANFGASVTLDGSLCGAEAANRSLNIIELTAAIVAGGEITGAVSGKSANTLLMIV